MYRITAGAAVIVRVSITIRGIRPQYHRSCYPRLAIAPTYSNQAEPEKCDRPNQKSLA